MRPAILTVRALGARYGAREAFKSLDFDVAAGQSLGVVGANGAGKTTLLRIVSGLMKPSYGEVLVDGRPPREAARTIGIAYFAGEATLPRAVRACAWGQLGTGDRLTPDRRPIRLLSRGTRQLLGLRTVLGRQRTGMIVLDEPWESLDPDTSKWVTAILSSKRDRGAALVMSSSRLHELAGICDAFLFLVNHRGVLMKAHEVSRVGPVTGALLEDTLDQLRGARTTVLTVP